MYSLTGGIGGTAGLVDPSELVMAAASENASAGSIDQNRAVTVTIKEIAPDSFQPITNRHVVTAEAVTVMERSYFEARYVIDGIDVVHMLESCDLLPKSDGEVIDCRGAVREEHLFGPVEVTGVTDDNGQAVLQLASNLYRLSVVTMVTVEDDLCHWSGSVIADHNTTSVVLPVLVYCESE